MPSRQQIKLYLGSAACVTLLVLILSDAWLETYTLNDRMIYLLLAIMSPLLGIDLFNQTASIVGQGGGGQQQQASQQSSSSDGYRNRPPQNQSGSDPSNNSGQTSQYGPVDRTKEGSSHDSRSSDDQNQSSNNSDTSYQQEQ